MARLSGSVPDSREQHRGTRASSVEYRVRARACLKLTFGRCLLTRSRPLQSCDRPQDQERGESARLFASSFFPGLFVRSCCPASVRRALPVPPHRLSTDGARLCSFAPFAPPPPRPPLFLRSESSTRTRNQTNRSNERTLSTKPSSKKKANFPKTVFGEASGTVWPTRPKRPKSRKRRAMNRLDSPFTSVAKRAGDRPRRFA